MVDRNPSRYILRARRLFDGVSPEPIEDVDVTVSGRRIESVRQRDDHAAAASALPEEGTTTLIDLGDRSLVPGLVDVHVHLVGARGGASSFTDPGLRALRAASDAQAALRAGFTTLRDCGSTTAIGLRDAIAEGSLGGPRILAAGPLISQTGGHADWHDVPYDLVDRVAADAILADGVDGCRRAVRRAVRAGADWIKICTTGGNTSLRDGHHEVQFTAAETGALVDEAHRLGRRVAAHATGRDGILAAVRAGVDSIEHGYFLDESCIDEMLARGTYLVPTYSLSRYFADPPDAAVLPESRLRKQRDALAAMSRSFPLAYRAGVPIATGTDCSGGPGMALGTSARELIAMVEDGVRPVDALRFATSSAANLLGLEREIGSVAPGFAADLVALEGDPWHDITAVARATFVMRDGVVALSLPT